MAIEAVVKPQKGPAFCFWRLWPEYTDPKTQSTNHPELRQTTDPPPGRFTERLNVLQGTQANMCAWKVFKVLSVRAHFSLCLAASGQCARRRVIKSTNDLCRYGCMVIGEDNPQNALGFSSSLHSGCVSRVGQNRCQDSKAELFASARLTCMSFY